MAAGIEGRITSLSDELVIVRSEDGRSEIRVALDLVVAFDSGDTRGIPKESEEFDFGLVASSNAAKLSDRTSHPHDSTTTISSTPT